MEANMAGDDASLDAAVALIAKRVTPEDVGGEPTPRRDTRENRTDRDPIEQDDYHDLSDLEAMERAEKAGKEPDKGDEKSEGPEASAADDAFIELPAAAEGEAPERVPLKEAVEAVQKLRQMDGEIANAVIKAEEETFQKHDAAFQEVAQTFAQVKEQGRIAMEMMRAYAPQEPHPRDYVTTEDYYQAKLNYEAYVAHYNKVANWVKSSEQGSEVLGTQQASEFVRRETERTARYIPEFKEEASRNARMKEYLDVLGPKFGLSQTDLDEIADHRAWRMIDYAYKTIKSEKAAPEVRKHVQEKAAKLVNGRLPERDGSTGRFIGDARKAHKEQGTEDSLARLLLTSGALNGL